MNISQMSLDELTEASQKLGEMSIGLASTSRPAALAVLDASAMVLDELRRRIAGGDEQLAERLRNDQAEVH